MVRNTRLNSKGKWDQGNKYLGTNAAFTLRTVSHLGELGLGLWWFLWGKEDGNQGVWLAQRELLAGSPHQIKLEHRRVTLSEWRRITSHPRPQLWDFRESCYFLSRIGRKRETNALSPRSGCGQSPWWIYSLVHHRRGSGTSGCGLGLELAVLPGAREKQIQVLSGGRQIHARPQEIPQKNFQGQRREYNQLHKKLKHLEKEQWGQQRRKISEIPVTG